MLSRQHLYRAAGRLHEAWLARVTRGTDEDDCLFERMREYQGQVQEARQRREKARRHGLTLVQPALNDEILARTRELNGAVTALRDALCRPPPAVPSVADFAAELHEAEDEFGGLEMDWRERTVTAFTEPVTLEGVYLGPFAVRFRWQRLADGANASCFDVVALEPNPAAADERVTHPHVQDEHLCAGEASAALRTALAQGRLGDAFRLVRGVLGHYNPNSAHVRLEAWGGEECCDCGVGMSSDDAWHCEGCDHDVCSECMHNCHACDRVICSECLGRCDACESWFCQGCLRRPENSDRDVCPACLRPCASCEGQFAADELGDETSLCSACAEQQPDEVTCSAPPTETPHQETAYEPTPANADAA